MNIKKLTQKDRYGNMVSFEFDVPPMESIPHPGMPIGTDTVPAWLTPGERVMNAEAERMYGPVLKQMNDEGRALQRAQGGTIPEYAACGSKVKYKYQGGPVYAQEGLSPEQMSALLANQVLAGALDPRSAENALTNMGMGKGQAQAVIPSFAQPQVPPTETSVREYPQVPTVPQTLSTELPPIRPQQVPTPTDYEGDIFAGRKKYPQVQQTPGQLPSEPPQKVEDRAISTRSLLLDQEGMKNTPYKDTEGFWTVGVGHRITDSDTLKRLNNGESVSYTDDQLMQWFEKDVNTATEGAKKNFDSFNSYSPKLQDALISMNYQLGTEGTRKFKDFRSALNKGDFKTALAELDDSEWVKQTPSRVQYLKSVINEEAANRVGNKNTISSTSGQPVVDSRFGVESTYRGQDTTPPVISAPEMIDEFGIEQRDVAGGMNDIPVYDDQALRMLRTQPQKDVLGNVIDSARETVFGSKDHQFKLDQSEGKPEQVDPLAIGMETYAEDDQRLQEQGLPPVPRDVAGQQGIEVPVTEDQKLIDDYRKNNPYSNKSDEDIIADSKPDTRTQAMSDLVNQNADELDEPLTPPDIKNNIATKIIEDNKDAPNPYTENVDDADAETISRNVETKGNQEKDNNPSAFSGIMDWLTTNLGDLFDPKELARMGVMYLGSRALGYSHGGSLNFAAKNYITRVDQKATTAAASQAKRAEKVVQMVADGKISPKAAEMYKRTGNLAYLDSGLSRGVPKGGYEDFYSNGTKVRARKVELPNGSVVYQTEKGQVLDSSYHQDSWRVKDTKEYRDRRNDFIKNNKSQFEDKLDLAKGDEKNVEWTSNMSQLDSATAAAEYWDWVTRTNRDPESTESLTIMGEAYQRMLNDAKKGNLKIKSLVPYLNGIVYQEETNMPEMFIINPEEVKEGKAYPEYVDQQKMSSLLDNTDFLVRKINEVRKSKNQPLISRQDIFNTALDNWEQEKDKYGTESSGGKSPESPFYMFMQDQLQLGVSNFN